LRANSEFSGHKAGFYRAKTSVVANFRWQAAFLHRFYSDRQALLCKYPSRILHPRADLAQLVKTVAKTHFQLGGFF
jgi:hypothetical protein